MLNLRLRTPPAAVPVKLRAPYMEEKPAPAAASRSE
jgi:hypothetical protein